MGASITGGYAHLDAGGKVLSSELSGPSMIGKAQNIDFKVQSQTQIISIPNPGPNIIVTDIMIMLTSSVGINAAPIVRCGLNPNYNELVPLTTLTGLNGVNKIINISRMNAAFVNQMFSQGTNLFLDIQTGANATTMIGDVFVLGIQA